MKQNITIEQYDELSEKAKDKLWEWADGKIFIGMIFPYLSIGQMIEFLDENKKIKELDQRVTYNNVSCYGKCMCWYPGTELCDALWLAVKEVLEN